jgi:PmbA protein
MALPRTIVRRTRELEGHSTRVLEILKGLGVDHAEVGAAWGRDLEVSVRMDRVELLKEAQSGALSVRVMRGGRVATSSTSDLRPEALRRFCAAVVEMADLGEEDPLAAPPEPRELAREWPELELFDPRTDRITAERAIALARTAERAALRADRRITSSEGARFSRAAGVSVLATSGGFLGSTAGTYQSLAVHAIADDADGKKRNGVYWTGGRFVRELEAAGGVGREAGARAIRCLGARKLESARLPVVFDRDAARAIAGLVASCVMGDAVRRERSYLAQRLGTPIASRHVTLIDDPLLPGGPGSRAFDGEGRRTRRHVVVSKGELRTFLLDTYSARKLRAKPTGSAAGGGAIPHASASNFYLAAGRHSPESLLRGIDRGLYVMRMMGFGFDPVTGNLSRGAEGFLIERGELTVPIGEITISRNLDDLLKGIDAVASDLDHRTSIAAPSFRVDEMTIAGA